MNRDMKHFEDRLEKDTFSKDEVAKLLHNEANFTEDLVKKNYKTEIEEVKTKLTETEGKLNGFLEKENNENLSSAFNKLNGNKSRLDDFKKLTGLTGAEAPEEIETKIVELKESGDYNFMFKKTDSQGPKPGEHVKTKVEPKKGLITPQFGINLFKKNK